MWSRSTKQRRAAMRRRNKERAARQLLALLKSFFSHVRPSIVAYHASERAWSERMRATIPPKEPK